MNKIEMGKTYKTRGGYAVRVLCVDSNHPNYPVIAIVGPDDGNEVYNFSSTGAYYADEKDNPEDLIEYSPWADVAVDTKVLVKNYEGDEGDVLYPRHFAGVDGVQIVTFPRGTSSHTVSGEYRERWRFAKLA